jgi:type 2 lantibiotic biosynthesis protein LanM
MEGPPSAVIDQLRVRGANLHERVALRGSRRTGQSGSQFLDEESERLFKQWKERLEQAEVWQERLATLGIGEPEFSLLALPPNLPESLAVSADWRRVLQKVFTRTVKDDRPRPRRRYSEGLPPLPPGLQRYVETELSAVKACDTPVDRSKCPDLDSVIENEIRYTLADLHYQLLPALVTELHVAAARGVLRGDTTGERFKSFCEESLASSAWLAEFLATYPVAVRFTETVVRTRRRNFVELLRRFDRDYKSLQGRGFFPSTAGATLHDISPWSGDRHREGRSVRILRLSNGGRVVYKPRPVNVDVAFQRAVRWLNEEGFSPDLYEMSILPRHQYGWFGFVESRDCDDAVAVGRFYRRQGAHLALLYLLGGHDFLAENVRAHGEYPVLVDLECFLGAEMPAFAGRFYDSAARRVLDESVLRTGLLPRWMWSHYHGEGVDLSALTSPGAQLTPQEIPHWVDRSSETLRQVRRRGELPLDKPNLPTLRGVGQPVNDFIDAFRGGFRDAYGILQENKKERGMGRLLNAFERAECRVLVRHTQDYHTLLDAVRHPRYLRDALRYSEFLDRLWPGRCPRYLPSVIEAEIEQLWRGDIPLFTTLGASRDLFNDDGQLVARNYFQESGIDAAKARLARLGPADLARQLEVIDGAFGIVHMPRAGAGEIPTGQGAVSTSQLSLEDLTNEATLLADRLLASAIEDEASLSWIGVMGEDQQWAHGALDPSLYDGVIGIGLLFLFLDVLTQEPRFESAWRKVFEFGGVKPARLVLENRRSLDRWILIQPGGLVFPLSALYMGIQAARFRRIDGLDAIVEASLEYASVGLKCKPRFDFVTGAAGLIRSLLVAYRAIGNPRALDLARSYGDLLVAHAIPCSSGVGWPAEYDNLPDLMGGFSHGVSGIAWVLADLANATRDERYLDVSRRALAYDRTLFSAREEQWKDLRDPAGPGSVVQWCHGPSGIGLSRVLLARFLSDDVLAQDVAHAVRITLAAKSLSDCLCHGTLGNADVCAIAAEEFSNSTWRQGARAYAAKERQEAHARGHWRSGVPGHDVGKLGLFMGTAGIGYGLLRLARPDIVPSVLFLEDPKPAASAQ